MGKSIGFVLVIVLVIVTSWLAAAQVSMLRQMPQHRNSMLHSRR